MTSTLVRFARSHPAVSLVVSLAVLAVPAVAAAAPVKVALLPVSGTNVHPGYLDAARDLMKDHLIATGKYAVVMAGTPTAGTIEAPAETAVQLGREAGAQLAVVVHLTRLAGTGRLRLIAYDVGSASYTYADTIAVAGGPDDLDPALKRLAVGMAMGKPSSQTADIESVTQKQADPLLKETATKIFGLRLGAIVPFNRPQDQDSTALPGIGVFWMYDARSFLGEVALDLHTADAGSGFSVSIGGYYPFSRGNLAPYLGAAASYSIVDFGGAGANGIRLAPAFGVLFGRLSTVQFRGEIGYFFNTFGERSELRTSDIDPGPRGDKHYAHGPQFSLGLGF